jgi:hypothetical protein
MQDVLLENGFLEAIIDGIIRSIKAGEWRIVASGCKAIASIVLNNTKNANYVMST